MGSTLKAIRRNVLRKYAPCAVCGRIGKFVIVHPQASDRPLCTRCVRPAFDTLLRCKVPRHEALAAVRVIDVGKLLAQVFPKPEICDPVPTPTPIGAVVATTNGSKP